MGLRREDNSQLDQYGYMDYSQYYTYSGDNYSAPTYYYDSSMQYYMTQYQYSLLANKAPTGIQYLDWLLYGGLKRGEVYLIAGEAGLGKTIFSLKFLKTGADLGEVGIYISVDEPGEDVKRGAYEALGWDLDSYEKQGKVYIYDFRTHFRLYAREGNITLDPKDVARMIIDAIQRSKAKRVVVDPIAPLIITGHQDILWVREYLRELVFQLKRYKDTTTILTSEIPTGETSKVSRFGVEEYLAGGVIILQLFEEPITHRILRILYIRKMRWTPIPPTKLVYEIQRGEGIVILGMLSDVIRMINQGAYPYYYYPYGQAQ